MIKLKALLAIPLLFFLIACEKDEPKKLDIENSKEVLKINNILSGDMVFSTHAKMAGVSKTLLPEGCPTKFSFQWDDKIKKLKVRLPKFHVGTMPFSVVFYCNASYSELNSWEKDEYPEKGWVKFAADDGVVVPYVPNGEKEPVADGAAILRGYVNPETEQIEFTVNYNMMNVVSHCFKQKIDRSRAQRYEQEFKKYEADLKKYKEENGL